MQYKKMSKHTQKPCFNEPEKKLKESNKVNINAPILSESLI